MRRQRRRAADVGHLLKAGRDDPVSGSNAKSRTDRRNGQETEDVFLLTEADHADLGQAGLHLLARVDGSPRLRVDRIA